MAESQQPAVSQSVSGQQQQGPLAGTPQQQQQQRAANVSPGGTHQPASQQLQSRGSAEGLQRVNSPGPSIPFDAAAYAAAAAARTASPGQLGSSPIFMQHPNVLLAPDTISTVHRDMQRLTFLASQSY